MNVKELFSIKRQRNVLIHMDHTNFDAGKDLQLKVVFVKVNFLTTFFFDYKKLYLTK